VLVLVATKLHAQRRIVTAAKKQDFLVACEPLQRRALPGFIKAAAKEKGNPIDAEAAEQLAERSEEHTSELQSREHLVCRLLLVMCLLPISATFFPYTTLFRSVLVLVATKLHAQRRIVTAAKKQDFLVACEPLQRRALPGFIKAAAKEKGNPIDAEAAEQLAE